MSDIHREQQHELPTLEEILSDLATSTWLKVALLGAIDRDPVDALNDAEVLFNVLRKRWEKISRAGDWLGPRKVGCHYFCGYWRLRYKVVRIAADLSTVTVLWEDGRTTTHATPWDDSRDKVLAEPMINDNQGKEGKP